ncbi:MAG TPA: ATP cone domain-containing protein [Planctomycetota bacterium]|nr:ATP cone domain-containing protein [Planctomycetota bacterium]
MSTERVRKRDGREVPFDETKIRDAVQRALVAVGEGDQSFASEVAGVVRLALANRRATTAASGADQAPSIEEIQDLVEHALIELGRASVAKAYILYRDRRSKVREVLEVHRSPTPGLRAPRVRPSEEGASAPWSKSRIVAALMNEAELARATAEEIAARVEARVFALGIKRISTALVRELVDNELVGMGLESALRRQASVLLPVHDLRRELQQPARPVDASRSASPEDLGEVQASARIAGEVLRRFALDHVLDDASAERHLAAELHVVDLAHPHAYLWAALPCELFAPAEFDESAAFAALGECARVLQTVSQGLVIEGAQALLAPLARARATKRGDSLSNWLTAVSAIASSTGRRVDLEFGLDRSGEVLERTLDALSRLASEASAPRVFLDEKALEQFWLSRRDDPERALALERLLERGQLVPTWGRESERFAAPGCQRGGRERAAIYCAGAVAINLPRLALRAGAWREDSLLEFSALAVEESIEALARLFEFQSGTRGSRPGEVRGRIMYAVSPVGLREALQILGDGEIRPEQGARLLGLLNDASKRMAGARGLTVGITPFFGKRAGVRFAEADSALPQHNQRLLFGDGSRVEPGRPYSSGYKLSPAPGFVPWAAEAQLLSTLPVGALHPLPEERSRGGLLSLAESSTRFFRLRREPAPVASSLARSEALLASGHAPHGAASLFDTPVHPPGTGAARESRPTLPNA